MLAAIEQQIFELLLTGINPHDREIKIHGRHMNRVNKHVKENRERVRHERRGYHRKVIDNTKINLRRNVTNPVDPLIYDATAVWSAITCLSQSIEDDRPFFSYPQFRLLLICEYHNNCCYYRIMTIAITDICVIFKKCVICSSSCELILRINALSMIRTFLIKKWYNFFLRNF